MIEGEAEKFGCEGVGFDVIECGEAGDEKGKVRGVVVFDTEVIYHQDKSDGRVECRKRPGVRVW